ncbi:hypothetical protein PV325_000930 [Microctonus aethiopoides]|nr:hypothetical protein PV325_000930 [Microctonus aethiopoides]
MMRSSSSKRVNRVEETLAKEFAVEVGDDVDDDDDDDGDYDRGNRGGGCWLEIKYAVEKSNVTLEEDNVDRNKAEHGGESSGSEAETEPARSFHRKLSTNKAIKNAVCWTKEGFLMKQTWSFQRWRRRYFKLKDRILYYAKDSKVGGGGGGGSDVGIREEWEQEEQMSE